MSYEGSLGRGSGLATPESCSSLQLLVIGCHVHAAQPVVTPHIAQHCDPVSCVVFGVTIHRRAHTGWEKQPADDQAPITPRVVCIHRACGVGERWYGGVVIPDPTNGSGDCGEPIAQAIVRAKTPRQVIEAPALWVHVAGRAACLK